MNTEKAKKAVELAELELQQEEEQKQIDLIKRAIKQTLENIKQKEKDRDKLNKEIKTLKQDIDNIRAGRLDLIAERQEKDDEAKRTSVIEVVKEKEIHHHHYYDRWYEPYKIIWNEPIVCIPSVTWTGCNSTTYDASSECVTTWTNSAVKDASVGTYLLNSGDCITLT